MNGPNRESGDWRVHPGCLIHAASVDGARVFVAETNSSEPPLILRDHRVAWALSALPERFTVEAAHAAWADVLGEEADVAFDVLAREGVLVRDDVELEEHDKWAADGWREAALFHHATRDYPFLAKDQPGAGRLDNERMERYMAAARPPPRALDPGGRRRIQLETLPADDWDGCVDALPPDRRRAVEGVGLLLDLACGVRRELEFAVQGTFYGKAVPSGGARHPTEVFLASFALSGLAPGVYQYAPHEHALVEVRSGETAERWRHASFDLFDKSTSSPLAVVAFASLWERPMWRYRDDRSARAPFIDLGHVIQVFREMADRLGFESYSFQKVRDNEVAELCAVEPRRLTPLYLATLA